MEILRPFDRRCESRRPIDLPLLVWGVDVQGERFLQEAHARDISLSGALLSGLDADLRSGDVIGILCGKRKARFRVIWVRYDGDGEKMQVAVHRIEADECPWVELLSVDTDLNRPDGVNAPSP
ncbi:MAG TPA: PilZ domain-containing protein [Candidatus Eisenbacteria bacterium]|nr:PilZ domain-containing protein [Candidatus Eisenbacteria bacterium]